MLTSFVVAFAISEILAGWGRQSRQREQVKLSALQLTASALLLLALVQALWGCWNFRDTSWTLGRFLVAFLPLLVLSTAPFIITPHISDRGSVDAGAHYFRVRPVLFGILCAYVLLNVLAEWMLSGLALHQGQALRPAGSDAGVAAGVVAMAHSLGLMVVAEGVDREEQLAPLAEMGCDRAQGLLYAPAVPASQAERFLPRGGARALALEPAEEARPAPSATEAAADPDADLPMLAQDFGDDLGRVLLVDDSAGSLATVSLRIARLGVDTHYASFVDEAHLFVNQEGAALRVLVAPPDIDLAQANEVVTAMAEQRGWRPPFLIVGEEPDAAQRAAIREAGVSSVLWAPFDDEELRFLVKSALSMPQGGARDEKRVPLNQMATLRVDSRRESALLSSLSVRGSFFETANPQPVGTRLRIDFELAPDHFRLFGEVRYRQLEEGGEGEERSGGVGVTFYGVEDDAEHALRKAVEERAARYLPWSVRLTRRGRRSRSARCVRSRHRQRGVPRADSARYSGRWARRGLKATTSS